MRMETEDIVGQADALVRVTHQAGQPQNENVRQQASASGDAVGEVAEGILDGALELVVEAGSAVLQGAGNVAIGALECGGAVVEGVCSAAGDILGGL
ncbi:MAG: hypothetical protein WA194_04940 [Patescibacteria group bacterium]